WSIRSALGFASPAYDILVALLLLFSGLSARMRDLAYRISPRRYVRVLVYLVQFIAVSFVLDFPLVWYRGFLLEHQFKLSNQTFVAWLTEQETDILVNIAVLGGAGLVSLAYMVI